jgi:TonB family protein
MLEVVVDEEGAVRDGRIMNNQASCYDRVFLDAVKQWRFEPGRLHGRPVPTTYNLTVTIHFR